MLGTDLYQAYDSGDSSSLNNMESHDTKMMPKEQSNTDSGAKNLVPPMTEPKNVFYDQDSYIKEAKLQQQIQNLQTELKKGNSRQMTRQSPSTIDLFVSKKKDVIKLLILSLTVLLGLSLHYVASDSIRNYLADNDFTPNQEFMTKVAYPLTVLLTIWTLKVYNR